MLVISTWVVENSYIPPPWTVSHSILGLFILEDQQIDLHPQTSSFPSYLAALPRPSHHGQLMGTSFASLIGTPSPWRGRSTGSVSQLSWGTLSSMPSPTSTHTLRMSIPLLSPTIAGFTISHLHFGSIFLEALHPLFDVVFCYRGLVYLCFSLGASWPPGLRSFPWWHPYGSMTFLDITHSHFHLGLSSGPINWATKVEPNIPCITKRKTLFEWLSSKNKIASPGARTTASVIHSSRPSWNMSAINELVHTWEGGGWSSPPSPKFTLTWTQ